MIAVFILPHALIKMKLLNLGIDLISGARSGTFAPERELTKIEKALRVLSYIVTFILKGLV